MSKQGERRKFDRPREKPEFDQEILDLARVTRVTEGGKHLSFRACVVLGDRHGRVGLGIAKGKDVQIGVDKAVTQAKKNMIRVPIVNDTIPHAIWHKFKSSQIMMKPAPRGSGVIAGSALRAVFDLAGVPNVSAKILGNTKNKITIAKSIFEALQRFKPESYQNAPVAKAPVAQTAAPAGEAKKPFAPKRAGVALSKPRVVAKPVAAVKKETVKTETK